MEVILDPADYDAWLEGSAGQELLRPYPSERMTRYPVSKALRNVKNIGPELIERVE